MREIYFNNIRLNLYYFNYTDRIGTYQILENTYGPSISSNNFEPSRHLLENQNIFETLLFF